MKTLTWITATCLALTGPALAQETDPAPSLPKAVKLITVQDTDDDLRRQFYGQVVARQTVDLAFQVAGQIVEFPAIEGEEIPKGGLVAKLDTEPFELTLNQAKLQKDQADRTLNRLTQLSENTVSQVSIDDTQTSVGLAAIAVRNAEYALEHATLHAPFDAMVATRNVANFSTIGAGTPVVRLHDMSELRIDIDVPEVLFQRAGQDPDVLLTARFPASDQDFPLVVREFNAEASTVGQTYRITLGMTPPEGLTILPGSSVTVSAHVKGAARAIVLPPTAIATGQGDETYAMVFSPTGAETGTLTRTAITIAPRAEGGFRVLSGLSAGQEIVITGVHALRDGQQVRRFTGFAN